MQKKGVWWDAKNKVEKKSKWKSVTELQRELAKKRFEHFSPERLGLM